MTENEEDRFGIPSMTTNQEVAVSFTLFVLGTLLVLSGLYPLSEIADLGPAFLGVVMMGSGYLFAIESIRELEEKDHFLSRKLMNKE
ncbi:MAG: hypothetical protein BRC28_02625 [Nanohaloarchaea archaeon SW_4_43_9]|nr:MAG: hypothetical protein BRC28_02625 [Nanohaloarchaea archaeon SW_4_43_9]